MKLNSILHKKLLLQAQEAKIQGLNKLASGILESIGSEPQNEDIGYSYEQLQEHIHQDLWKAAAKILAYYDVKSVNVENLDKTILTCADDLTNEIEKTLDLDMIVRGPFEPKVPGEDK